MSRHVDWRLLRSYWGTALTYGAIGAVGFGIVAAGPDTPPPPSHHGRQHTGCAVRDHRAVVRHRATTRQASAVRTRHLAWTRLFDAWSKVAQCEEGGWVGSSGYKFPDSLGISRVNWYGHGGTGDTSPRAQIIVARRIEGTTFVPDQSGCAAW